MDFAAQTRVRGDVVITEQSRSIGSGPAATARAGARVPGAHGSDRRGGRAQRAPQRGDVLALGVLGAYGDPEDLLAVDRARGQVGVAGRVDLAGDREVLRQPRRLVELRRRVTQTDRL